MDLNKDELFINPKPSIGYGLYVIRKSIIAAITDLKKHISGNVIDLGCGIMPYREFLMEHGKIENYTGIDLERSEYHHAIVPDLFWDGISIPLPDASQDWIIATEFLEHYFDTQHILCEIKRVLKPGGKLFFTVPCVYMLHEIPYDHHRFTAFALSAWFNKCGYSNNQVYPSGGFNYSLIIMLSLWNKNAGNKGFLKIAIKLFLWFAHRSLVKNDHAFGTYRKNYTTYKNSTMPSGLWGYAEK